MADQLQPTQASILDKEVPLPLKMASTGEPVTISLLAFWETYYDIHRIGLRTAAIFVQLGVAFMQGETEPGQIKVSSDQGDRIYELLRAIADLRESDTHIEDKAENLLAFTHRLLQRKELTYAEAAEFASIILEQPISANAWRMRIARWAPEHGKTIPNVDRGRPRKKAHAA